MTRRRVYDVVTPVKILVKTLYIAICVSFGACIVLYGFIVTANLTLLKEDFLQNESRETDVTAIAAELAETRSREHLTEEQAEYTAALMADVVEEYEPWLREQLEDTVYAFSRYCKNGNLGFRVLFPLYEIRNTLADSLWQALMDNPEVMADYLSGEDAENYIMENLTVFTGFIPEEVAEEADYLVRLFVKSYLDETAELLRWALPGVAEQLGDALKPYFDNYADELIARVPRVYVIGDSLITEETADKLAAVRSARPWLRVGLTALPGIAVILATAAFLLRKKQHGAIFATGIATAAGGIIVLAAALVIFSINVTVWLGIETMPVLNDCLQSYWNAYFKPLWWYGAAALAAGTVAAVYGYLSNRRKNGQDDDAVT